MLLPFSMVSPWFQTVSQAPSDAVKKMGQVLQALGANCLQEHSLPHLEFQLGPSARRCTTCDVCFKGIQRNPP